MADDDDKSEDDEVERVEEEEEEEPPLEFELELRRVNREGRVGEDIVAGL